MASKFFKAYNFFKKKSNNSKIAPDIKQPRQLKKTMEKMRSEFKKFGFKEAKTAKDRANIVRTKKSIERMNKVDELKKKRKEGIKASKEMKKMVDTKQAEKIGGTVYPHHVRERKAVGGKVGKDEGQRRAKPPKRSPGDPQRPAPKVPRKPKPGMPVDRGGKFKKPKPGSYDYQLEQTMKPGYRKEMKKGGRTLKPVDKEKNPGLAKLPTQVRNKMGYMKKGGRVKQFGGGKK